MEEKGSNTIRPDHIELLLGNTHRCNNCKNAFNQGRDGPDRCPECKSSSIFMLKGFRECIRNTTNKEG